MCEQLTEYEIGKTNYVQKRKVCERRVYLVMTNLNITSLNLNIDEVKPSLTTLMHNLGGYNLNRYEPGRSRHS